MLCGPSCCGKTHYVTQHLIPQLRGLENEELSGRNTGTATDAIQDKKSKSCFPCSGCTLIAFLLFAVASIIIFHAVRGAKSGARRIQCANNQKQLALALHHYHDIYGTFPPAYTTDADGNPLHSWRVLVLQCIDEDHLYNMYRDEERIYKEIRLDEPWDSPHNSQFHDKLPRIYSCTSRSEEWAKGLTPFQMIIGPDTISDGPNCTKLSDMTKNQSKVILIVESSVPVCWMKPEDLPQSALKNGFVSSVPQHEQPIVQGIGSPHLKKRAFRSDITGANAAMVDGSCHFFTKDTPPEDLLEKSRIRNPE